jgi:hypothetical protein
VACALNCAQWSPSLVLRPRVLHFNKKIIPFDLIPPTFRQGIQILTFVRSQQAMLSNADFVDNYWSLFFVKKVQNYLTFHCYVLFRVTRTDFSSKFFVYIHRPVEWVMGVFSGLRWPGLGADNPPASDAKFEERVELYVCFPSGPSRPVPGRILPLHLSRFLSTFCSNSILTQNCLARIFHPLPNHAAKN